jgi:hypothetical protein
MGKLGSRGARPTEEDGMRIVMGGTTTTVEPSNGNGVTIVLDAGETLVVETPTGRVEIDEEAGVTVYSGEPEAMTDRWAKRWPQVGEGEREC